MNTFKKAPDSPAMTAADSVIAEVVDTDVNRTDAAPTDTGPSEAAERLLANQSEVKRAVAGPRTRWAAIVWGLVFAALASGALYVVLSPEHRIELIQWVTSLEATTLALYGALAIGVIVLLFGLVGLLRRAQRALAARRTSA